METPQNKKGKKSALYEHLELTDEQRVEKLLDLIAEIVVDQVFKQIDELKTKTNEAKKQ